MTSIQKAFLIFSEHHEANVEFMEILCAGISCNECMFNSEENPVVMQCDMINTVLSKQHIKEIEELRDQYPEYFI